MDRYNEGPGPGWNPLRAILEGSLVDITQREEIRTKVWVPGLNPYTGERFYREGILTSRLCVEDEIDELEAMFAAEAYEGSTADDYYDAEENQ